MSAIKIWKQNQKWHATGNDEEVQGNSPEQVIDQLIAMYQELDEAPVEYVRRKFRMPEKKEKVTKKAERTPGVESSPEANTEDVVEIAAPGKEMVVIETRPVKTTDEVVSDEVKPIADITGLKHNTFAIVGKVLQTLKENNWTDDKIKVARTDMTANGGKVNDLFAIANKYVQVVEAGLPVIMNSGIPA